MNDLIKTTVLEFHEYSITNNAYMLYVFLRQRHDCETCVMLVWFTRNQETGNIRIEFHAHIDNGFSHLKEKVN